MADFMRPTIVKEHTFNKKGWLAETLLQGYKCAIVRSTEGEASLIDYDGRQLKEQLQGVIFEDSKRLHDTVILGELVGYIGKDRLDSRTLNELLSFDNEAIKHVIEKTGMKLVFVAVETLGFLGKETLGFHYEKRKMITEDVLISIDNTFEMKYKDNYVLSHPMEYSEKTLKSELSKGKEGIVLRNRKALYRNEVSENWIELLPLKQEELGATH